MNNIILEVKDLTVNFKTNSGIVNAIRGVNLTLNKGETLAIVGESGSGKSVTSKAIMGLIAENAKIADGQIIYGNMDVLTMSKKELNTIRGRKIAMIFQDPMTSLNPTMSIGKQIMESILEHRKVSKKEAKNRAIELLQLVGITNGEERLKHYPHQFSGGMRQRVVIAIALASEPEILICDEPTTALDVTIQSQILELIKDIQVKTNVSILFITHDLGVVANMADRVAVMYAGKILEIGTSADIFYDPKHPYTWGLLGSIPDLTSKDESLYSIPGNPPNMINDYKGDLFAYRSDYALDIDFIYEPPLFKISDTHYVASWLQHENAPKLSMPHSLKTRIDRMLEECEVNE